MTSSDDGQGASRAEGEVARRAAEVVPEWLRDAEHEPLSGRVPFLHVYYHELVALRPRVFAAWRPPPETRTRICGPGGALAAGPMAYRDAMRALDAADDAASARRAEITGTDWHAGGYRDAALRQTARDAHLAGELRALLADAGTRLDGGEGAERLSALCFSGGGIRSATFNLGVLQALAHAGTLPRFDYLSSVSGGGYVAGWYHAWARRARRNRDAAGPVRALADPRAAAGEAFHPLAPEPRPLERLREFSNYLTPRRGLLSADTWAAAALVTRNLLLNWLVFLPVLAAVVGVPQLAYLIALLPPSPARQAFGGALAAASLALAIASSVTLHRYRTGALDAAGRASPRVDRSVGTSEMRVVALGLAPLYLSALCLSMAALWTPWTWPDQVRGRPAGWIAWLVAAAWCIAAPTIGLLSARPKRRLATELVASLAAGAVAAALLALLYREALPVLAARPALYVLFALPTMLAVYLVARTLFVGFASVVEDVDLRTQERREGPSTPVGPEPSEEELLAPPAGTMRRTVAEERMRDEHDREWWARMSGWVLLGAIGWLVVSALCLLAGYFTQRAAAAWSPALFAALGGVSGIVTSVLGTSSKTGSGQGPDGRTTSRLRRLLLGVAAPACCVLVTMALASGNRLVVRAVTGEPGILCLTSGFHADSTCVQAGPDGGALWPTGREPETVATLRAGASPPGGGAWPRAVVPFAGVLAGLALLGAAMGAVVNVNRFSMHGLYRNRLVRAFLGASRSARQEDRFTGFSLRDDVRLHALWPRGALDGVVPPAGLRTHDALDAAAATARPLPIINTALNLVRGDQLAWQQRKAESFAFTPLYCGNVREGYRDARRYGGPAGVALGTAMTISGAAASPNMGYHSSPFVTILMTLFNARLGAWLGNTNDHGDRTFDRAGPRNALGLFVAELLGRTDARRGYVNLSDGGHFENLALYEVVLRRVRRVLVCDVGCDPAHGFGDLGNAVRKVRIDFGIPVEFRDHIRIPSRASAAAPALHCAIGTIRYSAVDGTDPRDDGVLLYVKPAIRGSDREAPPPVDVLSYASTSDAFPHEPTSDQWFDEAQFESYRALGRHVVSALTGDATALDVEALFARAERYVAAEAHDGAPVERPMPLDVVPAADGAGVAAPDDVGIFPAPEREASR